MSSRYYLFPDEGEPLTLSRRLVQGLVFGKDALPQYAGTRQRVATVYLEMEGGKPLRISGAQGEYFVFDEKGDIRRGLTRSAGDFMNAAFPTPNDNGSVVSLHPKLSRDGQRRSTGGR